MANDKLFKRRKPKRKRDYGRIEPKRESYEKILIVCEGEKSEPMYFREFIKHYRLSTANIEVCGKECGSAPSSILEYAVERSKEENADPFDRVFCVFDKDSHDSYDSTVAKIKPKPKFFAITSVPCFEYWVLLHFDYSTKPYRSSPKSSKKGKGKSACHRLNHELKKNYLPSYEKKQSNLFSVLFDKLEVAKKNAKLSLKSTRSAGTDNPSTKVHELVDFLQNLKT